MRYGFRAEAARVVRDVSEAARYFALHQLPELYAGIQRTAVSFPVQYLGANVPQAWAAGSTFMFLQALVGFQPDAAAGRLYVDPWLPAWLPDLTIRDLRIGTRVFDLRFTGEGATTRYEVLRGEAECVQRRRFGMPRLGLEGEGLQRDETGDDLRHMPDAATSNEDKQAL